jgi:hypothetical protein
MLLVELLVAIAAVVLGLVAVLASNAAVGVIGLVVGGVTIGLVLSRVGDGAESRSALPSTGDDRGAPTS